MGGIRDESSALESPSQLVSNAARADWSAAGGFGRSSSRCAYLNYARRNRSALEAWGTASEAHRAVRVVVVVAAAVFYLCPAVIVDVFFL